MNCKICINKYDHSKRKPISLSCPHTICLECTNKLKSNTCPNCKEPIRSKYPNLALLELIPYSSYDKLKAKLERNLISASELQQKFSSDSERNHAEHLLKLKNLKEEIDKKARDFISLIEENQAKLITEVNGYERQVNEMFNILDSNSRMEDLLKNSRQLLERNELEEKQLAERSNEIDKLTTQLELTAKEIKIFSLNCKFEMFETVSTELGTFGEIKSNEKTSEQLVIKARDYYTQKNYNETISFADKVLELKPKCATAFNLKGLALKDTKKFKQSINCFNSAIAIDPLNYVFHYNRGVLLQNQKDLSKAMESFSKAIELNPQYSLAYNSKGVVYNDLKDYKQAVVCFTKAIELDPTSLTYHFNLSETLKNQKEFKSSLNAVNKLIELSPNYSMAHHLNGLILMELKEYKGAIQAFAKACELEPHNQTFSDSKTAAIKLNESVEPTILSSRKKRKIV